METFIPILIAIVVFAFQAYANYQKEQEKARKRNPGQPPLPEDNAKYINPVPAPVPPQGPLPTVKPEFENYSGVLDTDGSTHTRGTRGRPLIPQRLVLNDEADVQPVVDVEEFDLRDAIIKSVILERPYN